ncbi:methyltransferase small domain protein [Mycoplasma sp. CAG:776]|nr:methyltransferase small domain protein [Mycoplasma sp. CAG:776]
MFLNQYFTNNDQLKSEKRVIRFNYGSNCFEFISDNGVFSKDKIDFGSITLLDTYLKNKKDIHNFLDVGCGYGFLSIVLAKELNISGVGVDVNLRALDLAKSNASLNQVSVSFKESNIYENIEGKFDLIITNPPIRAGKKTVLGILLDAKKYLNTNGELWGVIRKDQGAKSIIKMLLDTYQVEIKEKNKGFYVFVAKIS